MNVVLAISICINVFQAFAFWFFFYGYCVHEQKLQEELKRRTHE